MRVVLLLVILRWDSVYTVETCIVVLINASCSSLVAAERLDAVARKDKPLVSSRLDAKVKDVAWLGTYGSGTVALALTE